MQNNLVENIIPDTLFCNKCKEQKPLLRFKNDSRRAYIRRHGKLTICKDCENEQARNRYKILPDFDPRIINGKRICNRCLIEKSLIEFTNSSNSPFGRHTQCRSCENEKSRIKRKNRGLKLAPAGTFNRRDWRRYNKFGLSAETFKILYDSQNGKCGICKDNMDFLAKSTCVDHDHETGLIREILCQKCNLGLGHFGDDIEVMKEAVAYLEKHSHERVIETKLEIVKG